MAQMRAETLEAHRNDLGGIDKDELAEGIAACLKRAQIAGSHEPAVDATGMPSPDRQPLISSYPNRWRRKA